MPSTKIFAIKVPLEVRPQTREEIDQNVYPNIRAPEQIDLNLNLPLTEKVDIYGFGLMIY